jgi:hypothetical protein
MPDRRPTSSYFAQRIRIVKMYKETIFTFLDSTVWSGKVLFSSDTLSALIEKKDWAKAPVQWA